MKPTFFSRYSLTILLVSAMVFGWTAVFAVKALRSNKNEVQDWLPSSYPETRSFNWFQKHFAGEQFILVSWDGCTMDDPHGRLELLVRKLVPAPPVPEKADEADAENAAGAAKAKKPLPVVEKTETQKLFSGALTGPELVDRLAGKEAPADGDPAAEEASGDSKHYLTREQVVERFRGSLIGEDGHTTCAVFTLSKLGEDTPRKAVDAVRQAADECGIPRSKLHMGGPPVDNSAIDEAGESSLMRLAAIAGCIGLGVSWWCLRSFRLIAIVFISGIFGAGLSLAIVGVTPQFLTIWLLDVLHGQWTWPETITKAEWVTAVHMNAILLTMPALVYVAAVSGAIHLSNYYRDTIAEEGLEGAPGRSVRHAALPLGLATGTTAIGLFSLLLSELRPIQLFGLYSGVGVIASVFILCLTVPAAFEMWPLRNVRRIEHGDEEAKDEFHVSGLDMSSRWWAGPRFIVRHWALSCGAVAVLLIVCTLGLPKIQTSVQLMRMFPKDSRLLADYTWLEQHLGRLVPMEIVVKINPPVKKEGKDEAAADAADVADAAAGLEKSPLDFLDRLELVQRIQRRVEAMDDVGQALSAVTFAPPLPNEAKLRNISDQDLLATAPQKIEKPKYSVARSVRSERLAESRPGFEQSGFLTTEDGKDLWRVSARVWALKDIDYGAFTAELQREVEKEIGGPENQAKYGVEVVYTGLVPLVYKAQRSLLDGLLFGFGMDLVVVTLVMMLCVREWSAGFILAVPSLLPVIVVFGIMGWLGVVIDPGTVMAPAVALGVTVDDVVHFMIMYRGALKRGLTRQQALMLSYKGCARAIYQSWGVIGVGLASFAFSPFTPTKRFGIMMITLLSAALVGTLVALPAILASPLGGLFGRRFLRRPPSVPASPEAEAAPELEPVAAGTGPAVPRTHRRDEPVRTQVRRL